MIYLALFPKNVYQYISVFIRNMFSSNYVPRVTQLDALQLDYEVIDLLKGQLLETSKYFSPGLLTPVVPELDLLLKTLIFKYSVYKNCSTFGQQMLSLKYDKNLVSKAKLRWFYCYTILLKYVKDRMQLSYTTSRNVQSFLDALEKFQIIGDFMNLLRFLQTGKCPALIDYILNLEVATEKSISNRFTDYAWTRELLWHSFIEMLGFAAPLLNTSIVRRVLKERSLNIFRRRNTFTSSNLNSIIVPVLKHTTKCAECGNNPIIPHYMGCEHIFCHFCIQANKLDNPNYKCPSCKFSGANVLLVPSG